MNLPQKRVLLAIYNHPEAYPPTLNVITHLAKECASITVLCNNFIQSDWEYPENCTLHPLGSYSSADEFGRLPLHKRLKRWLQYMRAMRKLLRKHDIFIAHDSYPLASYYLVQLLGGPKPQFVWYHNHDVMERSLYRPFTLNWLVSKLEPRMFSRIDLFSLPADERAVHFPMDRLKGQYLFIPNYPSEHFFGQHQSPDKKKDIQLIFQGTLSDGHGFEELIELLPHTIDGDQIYLNLMGPVRPNHHTELEKKIQNRKAQAYVSFLGRQAYRMVPIISSRCHIGIAIFTKTDIMNSTLGTASNKIYEYAACGLPVLYYDNLHFRKHLEQYPWAVPTDLSPNSLDKAIRYIMGNYNLLSKAARNTFKQETNFGKAFEKAINYLKVYE
jgi:glycosyltransferase involved in cell wall biosynthesis